MHRFLDTLFKDKLRFYKFLSIVLSAVSIAAMGTAIFFMSQSQKQHEDFAIKNVSSTTKKIPQYSQIMSIIKPLYYSGLQALLRDDVNIQIDFMAHAWYLKNIHRFDNEGNVVLDEGRYGLCGELASFTYSKIKSILGPQYEIIFAQVAESGFFLQPQSSHIALLIKDKNTSELFLLDPSFHRYSPVEDCGNYLFYNYHEALDFVTNQTKDVGFEIDSGTPIFIHKDTLLFLTVETSEGRFDEQNFAIAIAATRRYQYAGRYVLLITRKDGKINVFENPNLVKQLFTKEVYDALYQKILSWAVSLP